MNKEILMILPPKLQEKIKLVGTSLIINEIRLRASKKVILVIADKEVEIDYIITVEELLQILIVISKNSIYSIQNDINNGYVVIKGGHRIGISGEVVMQDYKIKNIKNINSMNIRIARQVIGCADKIMPYIIRDKHITNTLIVSPPGCGKTTILRDAIRQLSNGIDRLNFKGVNVSVVDERGEIAAVTQGNANLDVGARTDVMSNISKAKGMEMLVRSMCPNVVATDEIGNKDDIEVIKYITLSGVSMLFTMHGKDLRDVLKKDDIKKLIDEKIFETVIFLSNSKGVGTIQSVYFVDKEKNEMKEVV